MNYVTFIGSLAMIMFFFVGYSNALQCYVCTSQNHTACEDDHIKTRGPEANFVRTCPPPKEDGFRVLCRKTYQTVIGEVRVIRDCGYYNSTEECQGTRNAEVVISSCQCFSDLCNAAEMRYLAPGLLVLGVALRAIY